MSSTTPRITSEIPSALPVGTRLGEFELLGLLGVGGFGIVYLAFDHALEREVAVKEYMPASLAGRTETLHVSLRSQGDADTFALGLRSFVNEAKMLARFDHPSLLKVHRFWEANGTAYMAMPVMRGQTLKEFRAETGHAPDEAWLRELLTPLLGAIEKLHSEGVYHRDIAPDNIQIGPEGRPVLLDFGAARRVIGDKSQTLTAILKPAYAPIEQYAEAGSVKQGPWTDLYALGATLHYLLLNRPPPPATTRAIHDEASGLSTGLCPGCSEVFLRTIDWMLAPRPLDRPQSVAALREVLEGQAAPPLRRVDSAPPVSQWDRTVAVGAKGAAAPVALPDSDAAGLLDLDLDSTRIVPQGASAAALALEATVFEPPRHTPEQTAQQAPQQSARPTPPPNKALPALDDFSAPPVAAALGRPGTAAAGGGRWLPAALGLGLVIVAVAAYALWPRGAALPAADLAASAAVAPALNAAASMPAPGNSVSPAVMALPESTVATVVVPKTRPAAVAAPAADPRAAAAAVPATVPAVAPAKAPAKAPAMAAAKAPTTAPATAPSTVPATVPETSLTTAPATVTTTSSASAVLPPPEPAKPAVAVGPDAVCGGRNPVLYFVCMERECLRSRFQSHGDCLKWRKEARREVN